MNLNQENEPFARLIRYVALPCLFLVPYTAVWNVFDSRELKPWRILDVLLTLIGLIVWRYSRATLSLLIPIGLFLVYLTIQPALFYRYVEPSDYSFLAGQYPLCLLSVAVASITFLQPQKVLRCVELSALVACAYQFFQFIVFYTAGAEYAGILNDKYQISYIGFYRIIFGIYGPSGFMGEAGQLAMYVGPVLVLLVVCAALDIHRPSTFTIPVIILSLLLTVSIGGILEIFAFLSAVMIAGVVTRGSGGRKVWLLAFLTVAVIITFISLNSDSVISTFFTNRISEIQGNTSERQRGEAAYWDLFLANQWFGYGFASFHYTIAQSSHFVSILADTGIVGAGLLLSCFVSPVLSLMRRSTTLVLAFPLAASALHMFAAYGTYQWPGVWCMAGLCVGLASYLSQPVPAGQMQNTVAQFRFAERAG